LREKENEEEDEGSSPAVAAVVSVERVSTLDAGSASFSWRR